MFVKAVILCGGLGTRLRPYTYEVPKPMMRIGEKPILQYVIDHLKECGIADVILTSGYLHEKIQEYFKDGKKFGVKIQHSIEKEALNTAGSVLTVSGDLKEPFLVVMGDAITDVDLKGMMDSHKKSKAIATVALLKHKTKIHYGVAKIENGCVSEFQEKPELEHYINIGIYIFQPEIFKYIKEKEDFAKDVFPRLLKSGQKINAYKIEEGVWIDIGRKEEYEKLKDGEEIKKMLKK